MSETRRRSLMLGCNLDLLHQDTLLDGVVVSIGDYFPTHHFMHRDSSWSQLILKAKRNDRHIVMALGILIAAHMDIWMLGNKRYFLTHVPGQSALLIADAIYAHLRDSIWVDFGSLLERTRKKVSQHRCKTKWQRHDNVAGSFKVSAPDKTRGNHIIVIDDIITSGATMKECCNLLKRAGASSVTGLALARTVKS